MYHNHHLTAFLHIMSTPLPSFTCNIPQPAHPTYTPNLPPNPTDAPADPTVVGLSFDLSNAQAAFDAIHAAEDQLGGPVHLLVCSAGSSHPGYFEELEPQVFVDMMNVNYYSAVYTAQVRQGVKGIALATIDVHVIYARVYLSSYGVYLFERTLWCEFMYWTPCAVVRG